MSEKRFEERDWPVEFRWIYTKENKAVLQVRYDISSEQGMNFFDKDARYTPWMDIPVIKP